jgi:hypothetical protein
MSERRVVMWTVIAAAALFANQAAASRCDDRHFRGGVWRGYAPPGQHHAGAPYVVEMPLPGMALDAQMIDADTGEVVATLRRVW